MIVPGENVLCMYVVVNKDGEPAAVCPTLKDASAFARCLGFDAPLDAMKALPVVEFAKAVNDDGER